MIYVKRDECGLLLAVSLEPVGEGWEGVPDDSPELGAFARALTSTQGPLAASDLALARVLEDLIDLLVDRSLIRFTDLPAPAQEKLTARRSARASLGRLDLLDDDDGLI